MTDEDYKNAKDSVELGTWNVSEISKYLRVDAVQLNRKIQRMEKRLKSLKEEAAKLDSLAINGDVDLRTLNDFWSDCLPFLDKKGRIRKLT